MLNTKLIQSIWALIFAAISLLFWHVSNGTTAADGDMLRPAADEIRYEATLPNESNVGHPLPLAATWNTGQFPTGFTPDYQMKMIEKGHYILPAFFLPPVWNRQGFENPGDAYFEAAIKKAAALKFPISFIGTEWEEVLTLDPAYFNLTPDKNPNVVSVDGSVQKKLDPFGPVDLWKEVGKRWTTDPEIKKLQVWYPAPPLVLFVSNNEASKLRWYEVEAAKRYVVTYGLGKDDNFKRGVVGDAWISRYRALESGMRDGLVQEKWKENARFIGYNAFGPSWFGRWGAWMKHSLYSAGRADPSPLAWDGASPSFYLSDWSPLSDDQVWSPQIESMNWIFMLKDAYRLNPDFWFEISTWDGDSKKRENFASMGHIFTPERYGGMVKFGMWLLRPRVIREFRGYKDTVANAEPYFLAVCEAVDAVHNQPILRKFWRRGELVANRRHKHPYQDNIPNEYKAVDRWFMLDTKLDPQRPWSLRTRLPVYSLALVLGRSPEREWLIYAYSPLGPRQKVDVALPDYGQITIDTSPSGAYYQVIEKTKEVNAIGPALAPPGCSQSLEQ